MSLNKQLTNLENILLNSNSRQSFNTNDQNVTVDQS